MFPLSQCKDFVCAFAMQMCVQVQHGISFDNKKMLPDVEKIITFQNCHTFCIVQWIRYSFGIGLFGEQGVGQTSKSCEILYNTMMRILAVIKSHLLH